MSKPVVQAFVWSKRDSMRDAASTFSVEPDTGLLCGAAQCRSPNQDERPEGCAPELVVIHSISLPPGEYGGPYIEQLFCNCLDWDAHPYFDSIRGLEVSAHLLIRRSGETLQFVPFTRRAWHAGESRFRGQKRCNDHSIGIELEGEDCTAYTDTQYSTLATVLLELFAAYPPLSARTLAAHSDIAPGRKTDPGPAFDWLQLYDQLSDSPETVNQSTPP